MSRIVMGEVRSKDKMIKNKPKKIKILWLIAKIKILWLIAKRNGL
jgi:hypothetical protein